jgi:hypothetical protein
MPFAGYERMTTKKPESVMRIYDDLITNYTPQEILGLIQELTEALSDNIDDLEDENKRV